MRANLIRKGNQWVPVWENHHPSERSYGSASEPVWEESPPAAADLDLAPVEERFSPAGEEAARAASLRGFSFCNRIRIPCRVSDPTHSKNINLYKKPIATYRC